MAELSYKERLQPSLLDRLTDDAPGEQKESREMRVLSLKKLRQCVLRDLAWLLNTGALSALQNLDDYPFAAHSVINYGMRDLAGTTLSGADVADIERNVRQAVLDFEPRILPDSLRIKVTAADDQMNRNAMSFEIEGQLWAQPLPLHLFIRSVLDLETGEVTVKDLG